MSNILLSRELQGSCPQGGDWYACTTGPLPRFVGCCGSDPCVSGCSDLKPASLGSLQYGSFPDQGCRPGFKFYTCSMTTSSDSFFGCCANNVCSDRNCTGGPAFLKDGDNPFVASVTTTAAASSTTSTIQASTTLSTAASSNPAAVTSTATQGAEPSASPMSTAENSQTNIPAIAGGTVGGIAALAIIAALLLLRCHRNMRHSRKHQSSTIDGWLANPLAKAPGMTTKEMDSTSELEGTIRSKS